MTNIIELGKTFSLPHVYNGYTIDVSDAPHNGNFVIYPSDHAGPDHDYDWTGDGWSYCGNSKYADSINEALIIIDELNDIE